MKFKIDENLPGELVDDLRAAGLVADTVTGQGLAGAADSAILAHVQSEGRALLTWTKGLLISGVIRLTSMRELCFSGHEPQAASPRWHLCASTCRVWFRPISTAICSLSPKAVFVSADHPR